MVDNRSPNISYIYFTGFALPDLEMGAIRTTDAEAVVEVDHHLLLQTHPVIAGITVKKIIVAGREIKTGLKLPQRN